MQIKPGKYYKTESKLFKAEKVTLPKNYAGYEIQTNLFVVEDNVPAEEFRFGKFLKVSFFDELTEISEEDFVAEVGERMDDYKKFLDDLGETAYAPSLSRISLSRTYDALNIKPEVKEPVVELVEEKKEEIKQEVKKLGDPEIRVQKEVVSESLDKIQENIDFIKENDNGDDNGQSPV